VLERTHFYGGLHLSHPDQNGRDVKISIKFSCALPFTYSTLTHIPSCRRW
jgi:hypothetical protein